MISSLEQPKMRLEESPGITVFLLLPATDEVEEAPNNSKILINVVILGCKKN